MDGLSPTFAQNKGHFQRLLTEQLLLTPEQRQRLHRRVREDFACIEPGEKEAGVYRYDHFTNNCVTRLRDQVLSSLEGDQVSLLYQRGELDLSYEDVIEESLADAIATNPLGVRLFPPALEQGLSDFLPGVPATSVAARDFLGATRLALEQLSSTSAFSSPAGRQALATALNLLNVEIPKRPRSFRESLFTPKRLRAALAGWINPNTGKTLLPLEPSNSKLLAQAR